STHIYPLALHDALPIFWCPRIVRRKFDRRVKPVLRGIGFFRVTGLRKNHVGILEPDFMETLPPSIDGTANVWKQLGTVNRQQRRSEEHTSELQSPDHLV